MKTLVLILFCIASQASAQTLIKGSVRSASGMPVKNANISLKGTYDGASADSLGYYRFSTTETGPQWLVFSAIGFVTDSVQIELTGKEIIYNTSLKEKISELNEVVISAGSFSTGDGKKNTVLNSLDVATTAGGEAADIFSALRTLPGSQAESSQNGFFVRGGASYETKTYFDGLLVKTPFGTQLPDQASRGRFSPFLFKGTTFSAGGYSAQYGQALSSALILESKDLPEKTVTNVSIMSVGGGVDQQIRMKNSSVSIGGNYYNLQPAFSILKQKTDWSKAPESGGGSVQYKLKTGESGMLKVYTEYSDTKVGLFSDNIDDPTNRNYFDNHNRNLYINSTYNEYISKRWKVQGGFSYSKNNDDGLIETEAYSREDKLMQGRLNATRFIGNFSSWKSGVEMQRFDRFESMNNLGRGYTDNLSAAFTEADIFFNDKLVARMGVRAEYSDYLGEFNLAPRTSLSYKTGKESQVSVAYGRFYQNPEDDYLVQTRTLEFEKADHYILNYQRTTPKTTFRIEAYYKDYNKLSKSVPAGFNNSGEGYARGIDIFWRDKKTIKAGDYWISYSFLDTRRNYRDYPASAVPQFAAKHTLNVLYKQWISALNSQISTTYTFATGRTYIDPTNSQYLGSKTPVFNNLSMNISYLTKVFGLNTVLYGSVSNLPGFKNVYGYHFSADGRIKQAITPPALRNVFIGMFITIGDDAYIN